MSVSPVETFLLISDRALLRSLLQCQIRDLRIFGAPGKAETPAAGLEVGGRSRSKCAAK